MKRPSGLIASTVILTLVSLLHVLFALGVGAAIFLTIHVRAGETRGQAAPPILPPWVLTIFSGLDLFIFAIAIWGIVTAIGLHRFRRWARNSVLIIGGGMAAIGVFGFFGVLLSIFVPPPMLPGTDAKQVQMMHEALKVSIVFGALVYGAMLVIGVWWLVYFNRENVRALFANAHGEVEESRRPLLIAVIALLLIIGALLCLLMAFAPIPSLIFGLILRGWGKVLFLFVYAILSAAAAIGLWRLKEWSRRLTLALVSFGTINFFIYLVRPSLLLSGLGLAGGASKSMTLAPAAFWQYFLFMMQAEMVPPIILLILIAFMLRYYRERFREPAEPPPLVPMPPVPGALEP